jgi:steroid 5-alpha reductase family enzyme
MAKETKFITVEPSATESTIELWQKFGWELIGAPQEILSQTSGTSSLERRGNDIYQRTSSGTTTHYVKITFQREKNMPNYAELVKLEEAYYTKSYALALPVKPQQVPPKKIEEAHPYFGIAALLIIIGILCVCGAAGSVDPIVGWLCWIGFAVFWVVGITLSIFGAVNDNKKNVKAAAAFKATVALYESEYKAWERSCEAIAGENNKKRNELLKRAESLLT